MGEYYAGNFIFKGLPMLKKAILTALVLSMSTAFAAQVKSKRGPINLSKSSDGGGVVCTVPFGEVMNFLKQDGDMVLAKANCGQGWVVTDQIETVASSAGDKALGFEDVDIVGWMDDPSAVFVIDQSSDDVDGVDLNRDFREMLSQTMFRENIEMKNGEN